MLTLENEVSTMGVVLEKTRIFDDMSEKENVHHKIYLVSELRRRGYADSIDCKSELEKDFITSIRFRNLDEVLVELRHELYKLL